MVLEAAGQNEAEMGKPVVGKAGYYLWTQLKRVGLERDDFRIHNVLSCQPPDNKLAGAFYERQAIATCSPLLDATISSMRGRCEAAGKTFVILTLGKIAFKRILDIQDNNPILKKDYYAYPFWSEKYQAWVVAAQHPSYLMRGNNHEVPILQFAAKRAVEIARDGLKLAKPAYLLDPEPGAFQVWVDAYLKVADQVTLSYDIETPYKQKEDESDLTKDDEVGEDVILRVGFSYGPSTGVSVPWRGEYIPNIRRLFESKGEKLGWNSENFDSPKIRSQA